MRVASGLRKRLASALAVLVLAVGPLWLAREHFRARWPWSGDAVSMVLPTALARVELANGRLPVWSSLYFQGESLLNPHSQLLYPPWWVTLGPLSLTEGLKLVLAAHFVAAPLVVYWYGRRADLPVPVAFGVAAAAALPLARLSWHHQKTLGWPWLLVLAGQLLPWEWRNARRAGLLVGLSGGMLLLASSLYYAFYGAVLVAPLFVLYRERERWLAAVAGAFVGVPAIVVNVLPYLGAERPFPSFWLTLPTVITGLTGLGPSERTIVHGFQVWGVPFEGYAVVGVAVVALGVAGIRWAGVAGEHRWRFGVATGGFLGLCLAANPLLGVLPVVSTFRTAGRANVVVALALLVFAVYGCRFLLDERRERQRRRERDGDDGDTAGALVFAVGGRRMRVGVVRATVVLVSLALVANAALGAVVWEDMDGGDGTDLESSDAFAAALPESCGDDVWVEMYTDSAEMPRGHLGMALLDAGYTLDAVYFASIGAEYRVRGPDDALAFDLLLSPSQLRGTTNLSGGDTQRVRGAVARDELRYLGARTYRGQQVHLYVPAASCEGATWGSRAAGGPTRSTAESKRERRPA